MRVMHSNFDRRPQSPYVMGLVVVIAGNSTLLAACSGASHSAAKPTPDIQPGVGQSLAGMAGSTLTGSVPNSAAGTSTMPGMSMPGSASPSSAPASPVVGTTVAIKNFAFAPAALQVK